MYDLGEGWVVTVCVCVCVIRSLRCELAWTTAADYLSFMDDAQWHKSDYENENWNKIVASFFVIPKKIF